MSGNREPWFERRIKERQGKIFGNAFTAIPKPRTFMRPFLKALQSHNPAVGLTTGGSGRRHTRGTSRPANPAAIGGIGAGEGNANSNAGSHGEDAANV
jgi:hypothetical protein